MNLTQLHSYVGLDNLGAWLSSGWFRANDKNSRGALSETCPMILTMAEAELSLAVFWLSGLTGRAHRW